MDTENGDEKKLTAKQRLEMFQSSMNQLVNDNQIKNVRQMLHEKYLRNKAESKQLAAEDKIEFSKEKKKGVSKIKYNKQMAAVFRFGTNDNHQLRNRHNERRDQLEVDPLLNDPNVLFENFAFDDDDQMRDDLPFFNDQRNYIDEPDEDDDDSFRWLILSSLRQLSWQRIAFWSLLLMLYGCGQWQANRFGFGAPFLMISMLLFIAINLRRKSPGELSAYSVFNPDCRPIPTVASNEQPREQILLGFGPL